MADVDNHLAPVMTEEALAALGLDEVAYLREIDGAGGKNVAIHVADGRRVAVAPTTEKALAILISNDLTAVSLH